MGNLIHILLANNMDRIKIELEKYKNRKPKKSDVAEIVNAFCVKKKWTPEMFKVNKKLPAYPRMAYHAKRLLEKCGGTLEDALVMIERNWKL